MKHRLGIAPFIAASLLVLLIVAGARTSEVWGSALGDSPAQDNLYLLPQSMSSLVRSTANAATLEFVGQIGGATYAVAVQGNLAYVGIGPRLTIVNVSIPAAPVVVGETVPLSEAIRGVTVSGNYAYVANGPGGLKIVNVSNPATPTVVGSYATGFARAVAISGNYAYVADQSSGLRIINVANPAAPTQTGRYDTPQLAAGVAVAEGKAYVADSAGGLRIINVTNPAAPTELGYYDTPDYTLGVAVAGNYAYLADGEGGLRIINVTNPAAPVETGAWVTPGYAYGVVVAGSYVYLADVGLQVINVANPAAPVQAGHWGDDTKRGIVVAGLTAYLADESNGLEMIRVADPAAPSQVGHFSVLGDSNDVEVIGNYAYVADNENGLRIVNVANPVAPVVVGYYDTPGYAEGVAVVGRYAYVADGCFGLRILDVVNPTAPVEVGAFTDMPWWAAEVLVVNNLAYIADGEGGLQIIDVANPAAPRRLGFHDTPGYAADIALRGSFAYIADDVGGLRIINVADPTVPTEVGHYDSPDKANNVALTGNYAYLADMDGDLRIIDITYPANPVEITAFQTRGFAAGVIVAGHYAYVSYGLSGVQVLDIANPSAPHEVAYYETDGDARQLAISGGNVFLANGRGGLLILRFDAPVTCNWDLQPLMLIHGWGSGDALDQDAMGFAQWKAHLESNGYTEGCNLFYAQGVSDKGGAYNRFFNRAAVHASLLQARNTIRGLNPNWNGHLDMIGHSYGGLNARFYLESEVYEDDRRESGIVIDNLFTLGSPHGGVRLDDELYPAAIYVGLDHLEEDEDDSAMQLLHNQMSQYNESREQPDGICYWLIGGYFNYPPLIENDPLLKALYTNKTANDIAVSVRSSLALGLQAGLHERYPFVVTVMNNDMHGYVEDAGELNLAVYRSYVRPINTFNEHVWPIVSDPASSTAENMSRCAQQMSAPLDAAMGDVAGLSNTALPTFTLVRAGILAAAGTVELSAPIDTNSQLVFYATVKGGAANLILRTPENEVITPSDPNTHYGEMLYNHAALYSYLIPDSTPGIWSITLSNPSSTPLTYEIYVQQESELALTVSAKEQVFTGEPVNIQASLSASGQQIDELSVVADIHLPNSTVESIELVESATGGYVGSYTPNEAGVYSVVARATGEHTGVSFVRTDREDFTSITRSATLTGIASDAAVDHDGDGQNDQLQIVVSANANESHPSLLSAVLSSSDGLYIDAASVSIETVPGNQTYSLAFDGDAILELGIDGPYRVTDLKLIDEDNLVQIDADSEAYITAAYSYRSFGPATTIYLSPTGASTIAGKSVTNADILAYVKATNTWDVLYDGSSVNTPKNLSAFVFQGQDIILGFSVAQVVPGLGGTTVPPQDLVRFTPTSIGYNNTAGIFAWFFDGSDVGLTTSGEIVDALWIDTTGRLYISTTGSGVVPANSTNPSGVKVKFQDEDVLRFTPATGSTGTNTTGTWELYWNPTSITGMSAEDINGYWEDPTTGHRYATIVGAFNIGNAAYGGKFAGNGTTILRFMSNPAAPGGWAPAEKLTWLATGATLPAKFAIDGIEMAR